MMNTIKKWIVATRLETTALAATSVVLGSALAAFVGSADNVISLWAAATAVLLQLVCNLANDYGDWVRGADRLNRVKLPSAIQTGLVTLGEVRYALWVLSVLALVVGLCLLRVAQLRPLELTSFVGLGALALLAAITYTMGRSPYGYAGWGDVAVFVFFGLLGVGGTFFLHTKQYSLLWLWPAVAHGCLVVGVLNVNNLRDIIPDQQARKRTLAVRWGQVATVRYHWVLLFVHWVASLAFWVIYAQTFWPFVGLVASALLLVQHGRAVSSAVPSQLSQHLEHLVLIIMLSISCWSMALWGMLPA